MLACRAVSTLPRLQHLHPLPRYNTRRNASTSNAFPYPTTARPTPHQIFHLPSNASQSDIKARYFDLVRIYHPDKAAAAAASPDLAHARFQAITAAYDTLRGKTPLTAGSPLEGARRSDQTTAAYRAAHRRRQELYASGPEGADKWKDRVILGGIVVTVALFVLQITVTRREAFVDALSRSGRSTARKEKRDGAESLGVNEEDKRLSA